MSDQPQQLFMVGAVFDEHRNTSRVWPVPDGAHEAALAELERFRVREPELYKWIAVGAPNLTAAEHLELFGEPYQRLRSKRA